MSRNFDDNYLDSILSDLERATDRLPNRTGSTMNSSSRQATTTVSKYEYNKSNVGNEPIYQNDRKTNVNELNSFLNEFDQARETYNKYGHTNGYSTYTKSSANESSSQQVNQLISKLESNLANPEEALKWRGEQERPITMTEYYEESKKVRNLGNKQATNIGTTYATNERIRSVSPAGTRGKGLTDVQQIRAASPRTQAILTTKTYETKATKQYPISSKSSSSSSNYQHQQQQQSSSTTNNFQSSSNQNLSQTSQRSAAQSSNFNQQQQQQKQIRQTSRASNATHELDDLMANLDDFSINDNERQTKTTT